MQRSRVLVWLVWSAVAAHVVVLRAGDGGNGPALSNALQLVAALLGVVACAYAAARIRGFFRVFWWCVAASVALWATAQAGWLYHEDVLHEVVPTISPINILFFFFFIPVGVLLFLPDERPTGRE